MGTRRRIDDQTAIIDWFLAHAILIGAIGVSILALLLPAMRPALRAATIIGAIATARLYFHPLRFARLSRVWIERGQVTVAPMFGAARSVEVVRVEHDTHAPWPCILHLEDGTTADFVAKRDSGFPALFDLEPSDRARYERPRDARDSITDLEVHVRR